MKKAIWFTGIFILAFMIIIGCYLLFFREKSSKMPEGTFVRGQMPAKVCTEPCGGTRRAEAEGMWDVWQRSA
ncbi:MAG: hypothetical protein K2O03_07510 [Lachnospiraceae bacterium]|nr:hypothetical protein [Lachnospiraceae bacterium]